MRGPPAEISLVTIAQELDPIDHCPHLYILPCMQNCVSDQFIDAAALGGPKVSTARCLIIVKFFC